MKIKVKEIKDTELTQDIQKHYANDIDVIKKGVKIVVAADTDLDGIHLGSLLINFLIKFIPEISGRLYRLETPIAIALKGNKVTDWAYKIEDIEKLNKKGDIKYMKGLGSWTKDSLNQVIEKDTFENMLQAIITDDKSNETLDEWFLVCNSNIRKQKIKENDFELIKL